MINSWMGVWRSLRQRVRAASQYPLFWAVVSFLILGGWIVRSMVGVASIRWMLVYDVTDVQTLRQYLHFITNLRIPIPPVIATLEILDYWLCGRSLIMTVWMYRAALVLVYVLALVHARRSVWRLLAAFGLSVEFIWATSVIHPYNPPTYDIWFPLFLWLFVLLLDQARGVNGRRGLIFSCWAGFFLSMAELTRPYMVLLLPVFLVAGIVSLRSWWKSRLPVFLLPLLIFSGAWHVHQYVKFDEIVWTNHNGFNIHRAWQMVPDPPKVPEPHNWPVAFGRWRNLNTPEHTENNHRMRAAVAAYIVAHPVRSTYHIMDKLAVFLHPQTHMRLHDAAEKHPMLWTYRLTFHLAMIFWAVQLAMLVFYGLKFRRRCLDLLAEPDNILILIILMVSLVIAIGEAGEEARFLLSLLPFFAALPMARIPKPRIDSILRMRDNSNLDVTQRGGHAMKSRNLLILIVMMTAVLSSMVWAQQEEPRCVIVSDKAAVEAFRSPDNPVDADYIVIEAGLAELGSEAAQVLRDWVKSGKGALLDGGKAAVLFDEPVGYQALYRDPLSPGALARLVAATGVQHPLLTSVQTVLWSAPPIARFQKNLSDINATSILRTEYGDDVVVAIDYGAGRVVMVDSVARLPRRAQASAMKMGYDSYRFVVNLELWLAGREVPAELPLQEPAAVPAMPAEPVVATPAAEEAPAEPVAEEPASP